MKNILFMDNLPPNPLNGGIARVSYILGEALAEYDYNIFYISLKHNNSDNLQLLVSYFPSSKSANSPENIEYLVQFILINKIDVIINHSCLSFDFLNVIKEAYLKLGSFRVVSIFHNSLLSTANNYAYSIENKYNNILYKQVVKIIKLSVFKNIFRYLYRIKYAKLFKLIFDINDRFVLVSQRNIDEVLFLTLNLCRSKVVAISNPRDHKNNMSILQNKKKQILWIGRTEFSIKRIDYMLYIWNLVQSDLVEWELIIIGTDSEMSRAVQLSIELNLNRITFLGAIDPTPYYKTASIFCSTSISESFGMAILESMSYGIIPFSFDSFPAVADLIDNEINGYIIPAFDITMYAKKLVDVAKSDIVNFTFRSEAALLKSDQFDKARICERWNVLLNELTNI